MIILISGLVGLVFQVNHVGSSCGTGLILQNECCVHSFKFVGVQWKTITNLLGAISKSVHEHKINFSKYYQPIEAMVSKHPFYLMQFPSKKINKLCCQ